MTEVKTLFDKKYIKMAKFKDSKKENIKRAKIKKKEVMKMKNIKDVKKYIMNYEGDFMQFEMIPIYDGAKSFYKKAIIKQVNNLKLLYSYNTLVCIIYDNCKGIKYILNDDVTSNLLFSNTTLRHIKEFLKQNIAGINKNITKKDIIKYNNKSFI